MYVRRLNETFLSMCCLTSLVQKFIFVFAAIATRIAFQSNFKRFSNFSKTIALQKKLFYFILFFFLILFICILFSFYKKKNEQIAVSTKMWWLLLLLAAYLSIVAGTIAVVTNALAALSILLIRISPLFFC